MGRFEVYDAASRPLRRQPCVYAVPNSINSLPGTEGACDVRTPDKLSNGKKTQSPAWTTALFRTSVCPFSQASTAPGKTETCGLPPSSRMRRVNRTTMSSMRCGTRPCPYLSSSCGITARYGPRLRRSGKVRLHERARAAGQTPSRGVQELMIFVDDLLVFCGAIRQAPPPPGRGGNGEDFGQCIRCGPGQPLGSSSAEQVRPCQPEVPPSALSACLRSRCCATTKGGLSREPRTELRRCQPRPSGRPRAGGANNNYHVISLSVLG